MLKKPLFIIILAMLLLPVCSSAEKSAVLVIVDGMGSSYVYPEHKPACIDGTPLPVTSLDIVANATAHYDLWVPTPETESGNAVIASGYSGATEDVITYYGATIYDALRKDGYLSMAIMETGDNANVVIKPDIIVHDQANSIYAPDVVVSVNSYSVPSGVQGIMQSGAPAQLASNTDRAEACREYDEWPLDRAVALVQYMGQSFPDHKYLLVVDVGGADMSAHESGFSSYRQAITDLNPGLNVLATACKETGTIMLVTADHGMSFKSADSKGSHATGAAVERNESRLAPLLVFTGEPGNRSGLYGQECLAPTLLALMGCPDTLSIEDGQAIPVSSSISPAAKVAGREAVAPAPADWLPYVMVVAMAIMGLVIALWLLKRR